MKKDLNYSQIDTLVFEGGSVKGLAYVGALRVFEQHRQQQDGQHFLSGIQRVAGTSAGAIMALLIALGLNIDQINIVMEKTSFTSFADMSWYAAYGGMPGKGTAIYQQGYLCEGAAFMRWVETLMQTYTGKKDCTFDELAKLHGSNHAVKRLHVFAVRLNDGKIVEFSAKKTPTVSVALAVRMSMSIPVFFKPVRVQEQQNPTGQITNLTLDEVNGTTYYVDGGVKANYPYQLVKDSEKLSDDQLLGFKVDSDEEILHNAIHQPGYDLLVSLYKDRTQITEGYGCHLILRLLDVLMSSQEDIHNRNQEECKRTVRCWDCQISTFDFALGEKEMAALLASGVQAAMKFISRHEPQVRLSLEEELKAAERAPLSELEFASQYAGNELKRMNTIVQTVQEVTKNDMVLDAPKKQHLKDLKSDLKKLNEMAVKIRARRQIVGIGRGSKVGDDAYQSPRSRL
jgi:NTE family protein